MAGEKFLKHDAAGGFSEAVAVQVGGGGNADKLPSLDAAGLLDITMMPSGVGAPTAVLPAAGALAAGDFVNVFDDAAVARCRLADASAIGTRAHGYVLAAVADLANATVYFGGLNNGAGVTGLTAGEVFLSETAGDATNTAPTTSSAIVQKLGVAVAATSVNVEIGEPILLA